MIITFQKLLQFQIHIHFYGYNTATICCFACQTKKLKYQFQIKTIWYCFTVNAKVNPLL